MLTGWKPWYICIGAVSRPVIIIEGMEGDEVVLRCEADRLLPRACHGVVWRSGTCPPCCWTYRDVQRPWRLLHCDKPCHRPELWQQHLHLSRSTVGDQTHEGETSSCSRWVCFGYLNEGTICKKCPVLKVISCVISIRYCNNSTSCVSDQMFPRTCHSCWLTVLVAVLGAVLVEAVAVAGGLLYLLIKKGILTFRKVSHTSWCGSVMWWIYYFITWRYHVHLYKQ